MVDEAIRTPGSGQRMMGLFSHYGRTMATEETASSDRYLTKRHFVRFYKWLTVLALAAVVVSAVASAVVPRVVTEVVVGSWLLVSLLLLVHMGTHNDPI